MAFGYYRFYKGVDEQRELMREMKWARLYLEPLLRAEEDRHIARRFFAEMRRQELVADTMSPETRADFEEPLYNDKSKTRFPRYTSGLDPAAR